MLKKEIEYEDLFGQQKKQTYYFGFTKSELTMMQTTSSGGLENTLHNLIETNNTEKIMGFFQTIILDSYGVKSDDGSRFMKNAELKQAFFESPAYDVLFMDLLSSTDKAIEFVKGIMPKGIEITSEDIDRAIMENGLSQEETKPQSVVAAANPYNKMESDH